MRANSVRFWVTVLLSDRCSVSLPVCLSCLSLTLVYCGQMVGRIKMKLGTQVDLGPGHTVLDGDPAPNFGRYLLWGNRSIDQDDTW